MIFEPCFVLPRGVLYYHYFLHFILMLYLIIAVIITEIFLKNESILHVILEFSAHSGGCMHI